MGRLGRGRGDFVALAGDERLEMGRKVFAVGRGGRVGGRPALGVEVVV
jgi:hypothetical protein